MEKEKKEGASSSWAGIGGARPAIPCCRKGAGRSQRALGVYCADVLSVPGPLPAPPEPWVPSIPLAGKCVLPSRAPDLSRETSNPSAENREVEGFARGHKAREGGGRIGI